VHRLSFGGVMHSEAIKLLSLRSTLAGFIVSVSAMILLGTTVASGAEYAADFKFHDKFIVESTAVSAVTVGVSFVQIVVAGLSVLAVTSEFSTGSIRSTLVAVPSRTILLAAKAVVMVAFAVALGIAGAISTAMVTGAILSAKGYAIDYANPAVWMPILNSVVYLGLIALINLAIGALFRSSVAALAVMFALIQIVPLLVGVVANAFNSVWLWNVDSFFPTNGAGGAFYAYLGGPRPAQFDGLGHLQMTPLEGLAVLVGWVLATSIPAVIAFKRRDI
jgi:ABC-2 type transport system permease protein